MLIETTMDISHGREVCVVEYGLYTENNTLELKVDGRNVYVEEEDSEALIAAIHELLKYASRKTNEAKGN